MAENSRTNAQDTYRVKVMVERFDFFANRSEISPNKHETICGDDNNAGKIRKGGIGESKNNDKEVVEVLDNDEDVEDAVSDEYGYEGEGEDDGDQEDEENGEDEEGDEEGDEDGEEDEDDDGEDDSTFKAEGVLSEPDYSDSSEGEFEGKAPTFTQQTPTFAQQTPTFAQKTPPSTQKATPASPQTPKSTLKTASTPPKSTLATIASFFPSIPPLVSPFSYPSPPKISTASTTSNSTSPSFFSRYPSTTTTTTTTFPSSFQLDSHDKHKYPTTPSPQTAKTNSTPTFLTPSPGHKRKYSTTPSPQKAKSTSTAAVSPGKSIKDYFKTVTKTEASNQGHVVEVKTVTTISYKPSPSAQSVTPQKRKRRRRNGQSQQTIQTAQQAAQQTAQQTTQQSTPQQQTTSYKERMNARLWNRTPPERVQPRRTPPQPTATQSVSQPKRRKRQENGEPKKKTFFRPSVKDGRKMCLFCGKTEKEATYEGKMMFIKKLEVYVHFECLYCSSRAEGETFSQMVCRVAGNNRTILNCKHCKQKAGSIGCSIAKCPKIFHYKCAIDSGGNWDSASMQFYCKQHFNVQNQELIPVYKAITKWPKDSKVKFLRDNIWDDIKTTHKDYIARYARIDGPRAGNEDDTWTIAWEGQDFIPKIEIRQIGPGHWAWCPDLGNEPKKARTRQYEAVAIQDIKMDDFIGEYIGRVRYENPATRNPYVTSMFVPTNPKFRAKMGDSFLGLCVDSSVEGNETRFINSITRDTPCHIQQNATMDTVWCRGQLRVIIRAIQLIPKGTSVVLNYDEYKKDDGKCPYFASSESEQETETKKEKQINEPVPISYVVVPYINNNYEHPKKKAKSK
eukprot:Phypoly_transcript_02765.p1 GENE.Phypoly_transcript_02765~~Phypoly_transcript_02765.p1  ORF type:complete len:846 (+),score=188.15 Phypoly_transcript_02765:142-2679(+)